MQEKDIKEKCNTLKMKCWQDLTDEEQEFLLAGVTDHTENIIYFYDLLCAATQKAKVPYPESILIPSWGEAIII